MAHHTWLLANRLSPSLSRLASHLSRGAVFLAVVCSILYVVVALLRVFYPYDIDFLEDSMLMHALRIAQAQPVYLPPNAEFVPHVYMPLYMWLGGLLLKLTGPSYVPLRLISFAATLATAAIIYRVARRESGLRWVAIASAGLWLGGYRLSGGWYELARVDSLFVSLALGGFALGALAGCGRPARRVMLSALVLALATLAKQTGVIFAAALALYLLAALGRRVWLFAVVYGALVLAPLAGLNVTSGGWFYTYAFGIASSNPIEVGRILDFVRFELFGLMAALAAMALIAAWLGGRRAGWAAIREQPWLIGIGAAIAISSIGRASVGGATNNLMPVYALLCLAPSLLMREWTALDATKDEPPPLRFEETTSHRVRPAKRSPVFRLSSHRSEFVAALIILQFALGVYNPFRFIPTPAMRAGGDRLIERIASIDGQVWVMQHPYYALLAGKQPSAQIAVVWHARDRGALPLPVDLVHRIRTRYYAAIISDESLFETDPPLAELIAANYVRSEALAEDESPPALTGMPMRPAAIYVPRP